MDIKIQNPPSEFSYNGVWHILYAGNNWHSHTSMWRLATDFNNCRSHIFDARSLHLFSFTAWRIAKCYKFLYHLEQGLSIHCILLIYFIRQNSFTAATEFYYFWLNDFTWGAFSCNVHDVQRSISY